jgi:phosphate transport system substrate-binding protein
MNLLSRNCPRARVRNFRRCGAAHVAMVMLLAVSTAFGAGQNSSQTNSQQPKNSGHSIWTQNVTGFRKEHGSIGGYKGKKRWDLSDLPHYAPKEQVSGTIRIWGNNYLTDGELGQYWVEEFKKLQPGITLEYHLPTGAIAVSAVAAGVADLGMAYTATLTDRLVFEQVFHHPLTEITAVTGSYDVYGWGPAGIIVVNKENPLTQISMKQLDGVFGGARTGGYEGSVWHTEYPYSRGAEENVRTWGGLGLTGEWATVPIHAGGQNLSSGAMRAFSNEVLMGSLQFVEGLKAYTNYIDTDGKMNSWSAQVRRQVANDRYAMYYASPLTLSPDMHELAIQPREGGPFVKRTLETVRDNSYPLTHHASFYLNRTSDQPLDPKVNEFLHFVLSQEGQECVQREGRYLPLTAAVVREQLKKLE